MGTRGRRRMINRDGATRASGVFGGAVLVPQMVAPAGYATWQDKTSTALRTVGLGGALDQFENWFYSRSAPSDTPPDLRSVTDSATGGADPRALISYPDLPPLTHTANNASLHPVVKVPGAPPVVFTAVTQPDPLHRSIVVDLRAHRRECVDGSRGCWRARHARTWSATGSGW
jgi:hypothetical protein